MERQQTIFDDEQKRRRYRRLKRDIVAAAPLRPPLKAVLTALWEFTGDNRFCWPALATLAARLGYAWPTSRRALQAKLAELRDMGVLRIETRPRPDGSTASNKYRIIWTKLRRLDGTPPRSNKRPPALEQAPPRAQTSAPPRSNERPPALAQAPLELVLNNHRNPTTATEPTRTTSATLLGDYGIDRVQSCLDAAAAAGMTWTKLSEIVAVAKSAGTSRGEWKIPPGMLFDRIRTDTPNKPPATGWHPAAAEALKAAAARTNRANLEAVTTAAAADLDAKRQAERDRLAHLERTHGAALDALTPEDLSALCEAANLAPLQTRAAIRNRRAPIVRPDLLRHLATTSTPAQIGTS